MACFATIREILLKLTKVMAPFMPFTADYIYKDLNGKKESVHLEDWPEFGKIDEKLKNQMELTREICEIGHNLRKQAGVKVRQALSTLAISKVSLSDEYKDLIKDELNLKEVEKVDELPKDKNWERSKGDLKVALNTKITEKLEKQGIVREITRRVNGLRKKAKLTPDDQIKVYYKTKEKLENVISEFTNKLENQTRSKFVTKKSDSQELIQKEYEVKGEKLNLILYKKD